TFSQDFLRTPVGVSIGRINEIAPLFEVGIQNCQRFPFIAARHAAPPGKLPNVIVPRQISETFKPVRPSNRIRMYTPLAPVRSPGLRLLFLTPDFGPKT